MSEQLLVGLTEQIEGTVGVASATNYKETIVDKPFRQKRSSRCAREEEAKQRSDKKELT